MLHETIEVHKSFYVIIFILLSIFMVSCGSNTQPVSEIEKLQQKFKKMSVQEHLEEAKREYSSINITQESSSSIKSKIYRIKRHLNIIGNDKKEYQEAQKLLADIQVYDAQIANKESAEHLVEAKKALVDTKRSYKDIDVARKHIEAIPKDAKEYQDAQNVLKEVTRREKEFKEKTDAAVKKLLIQNRKEMAHNLEIEYLKKGLDVRVTAQAKENTVLHLRFVLFSRPLIYKITNETNFLDDVRKAGFKKVIFSDGYNYTWSYKLD